MKQWAENVAVQPMQLDLLGWGFGASNANLTLGHMPRISRKLCFIKCYWRKFLSIKRKVTYGSGGGGSLTWGSLLTLSGPISCTSSSLSDSLHVIDWLLSLKMQIWMKSQESKKNTSSAQTIKVYQSDW